jgi:hypothetical protein
MFWCMGGGAGNLLLGQPGYCDGEHYPDGGYWHVINAPVVRMRMDCVIDNGSPLLRSPHPAAAAAQLRSRRRSGRRPSQQETAWCHRAALGEGEAWSEVTV